MSFFFCIFVDYILYVVQSYKKNRYFQTDWNNSVDFLSHAGFLLLIGLAAYFHSLRSTFGPSAMTLFNLVNNPNLDLASIWITPHWFQTLITLFAIKCSLSLSLISLVFSASPMLFSYCVFLLTRYGFKQKHTGVFLLLLFLGIHQTFFAAMHKPMMLAIHLFLILSTLLFIGKRLKKNIPPLFKISIWALGCLFLFTQQKTNSYADVLVGEHQYSLTAYLSEQVVSAFVISFALAGLLILFWIVQKKHKILILFSVWMLFVLGCMGYLGRNPLLDIHYELLFFPLIAGIIGFSFFTFQNLIQRTSISFGTLLILVILSIFGQTRSLPEFERRNGYVVKLLQHAPKNASKMVLSEHLQLLERYIDPTYLAFETPLISKLSDMPIKSIYFSVYDSAQSKSADIPTIAKNVQNSSFFQFQNTDYLIYNSPFIKRKLHQTLFCDFTSVRHNQTNAAVRNQNTKHIFQNVQLQTKETLHTSSAVITNKNLQWAMAVEMNLLRGDSICLSVWRKGSNNGHLILSDDKAPNSEFWIPEQEVSSFEKKGWKKLSSNVIIPTKQTYKAYVWNQEYQLEAIYFDEFRIEIWRE